MNAIKTLDNEIVPYKMITVIKDNCFFYNINGQLFRCSKDERIKFLQWLTNN